MIPLRVESPRRTFPSATLLLIALNVGMFGYQISLPPKAAEAMVTTYGLVPSRTERMVKAPRGHIEADVLPLVTSMFLHGGLLHLLGNMLFLWVFGASVEGRLGHAGYLAFYLFCGLASGVVHILANWGSGIPSIGASGAISGIMGSYIILFPTSRILTLVPLLFLFFTVRIPALLILSYWFLIQFLSGLSTLGQLDQGGVAWWAHIGGFIVGALMGLIFRLNSVFSKRAWL